MAKKTVTRLKRITLSEISLVDRPACDLATVNRIEVAKRMSSEPSISAEERGVLRKFFAFLFPEVVKTGTVEKGVDGYAVYAAGVAELGCALRIEDVEKAKGKDGDYGDVAYADPGYQSDKKPRYPIDTEEHIRAAWSYINQEKNAAKYSSEDAAKIKAKIIAAWKAKIDKDGPPSAAKALEPDPVVDPVPAPPADAIDKSLWDVAGLAQLLMQLHYMVECLVAEQAQEGDNSEATNALVRIRDELGQALVSLADEEVGELTEEKMAEATTQKVLDRLSPDVKAVIEAFQKGELSFSKGLTKEQAASLQDAHDHIAAMGMGPHSSEEDAEKLDEKGNVVKRGRYSKADKEHGDKAHEAIAKMGVTCAANKADAAGDVSKLRTEVRAEIAGVVAQMNEGFKTLSDLLNKSLAAPQPLKVVTTELPPGTSAVQRSLLDATPAAPADPAAPAAPVRKVVTEAVEMADVIRKVHANRQGLPLSEVLH